MVIPFGLEDLSYNSGNLMENVTRNGASIKQTGNWTGRTVMVTTPRQYLLMCSVYAIHITEYLQNYSKETIEFCTVIG
jgi:hypothetical protein